MKCYTKEEFAIKREQYIEMNNQFKKKLVFHVGTEAGLYSELGSMFEAMMYAYVHKMKFILYADDANFSNTKGWEEFFEPFCEQTHVWIHKYLNRRRMIRRYPRIGKICHMLFKKIYHIDYLTCDVFQNVISREFKEMEVDWPLFDIREKVYPGISKLFSLGMRYNDETWSEIKELVKTVQLPVHYMSIQIRGGDKLEECEKLYDAEACMRKVFEYKKEVTDLFVFTDDYRNIEYLRQNFPSINIYTLTHTDERGYVNADFQKSSWENKKKNLLKLFAMVEICCDSDLHFGYEQASVNNIIKAYKSTECYLPLMEKEEGIRKERKRGLVQVWDEDNHASV